MTTRISADIHFGPDDVRHKYHAADERCHAYGALKINSGDTTGATLYFDNAAHIDAVIAELVALRNEMEPYAAITDSERTCDEVNPDGHWPCHRSGKHDEHRDHNGGTWRTDLVPRYPSGRCLDEYLHLGNADYCQRDAGHDGQHVGRNNRRWNAEPAAVSA